MLKEIPLAENESFRRSVVDILSQGEKLTRTVGTPARTRPGETVFWFPTHGLWAFFPPEPLQERRWGLWFGYAGATPDAVLTPSLEVNIRAVPGATPMGRALRAENGSLVLAHTGKLGGNAQHATIAAFTQIVGDRYHLFPTSFTNIHRKTKRAFVMANLSDPDPITQIARYVKIVWEVRQGL